MYLKLACVFISVVLSASFHVNAKVRGEAKVTAIKSEVLGESRELLIHLPNNYSHYNNTTYPVLYLLDGQRNFAHTVGTLDLLNQSGMAQEMIVIGITNTERTRDFTPTYDESYNQWGISGGADNFLDFLEKELKPFVTSNYRTNNYAILAGHSLSALFSVYALHERSELFQAYFAFSPSLWWHEEVIFSEAKAFFASGSDLNKYLYINMGNEGGNMLSAYERYAELLKSSVRKGFTFDTELDTSESHNTTALAGMSLALQKQLNSLRPTGALIQEGIPALEQYYKDLSEKYGFQAKPEYKAVNHAGYAALKKQDFESAIAIFKKNVASFPNKSDAYDSLADGYEAKGDLAMALTMREKALAMSYEENVENGAYKTRLANLRKKIEEGEELKEADLLKTGLAERIRIEGQEEDFQSLEQRQAHYDVPGVSVAFMRNGQIAWTMQSGVKDVTTGLVVDENTVFQAGSISKPAFAAVIMKYRKDNPLDLDTDVNNLLTSWQLPEHEWTGQEEVSLRRLLSHTAGTTVHGFPGYAAGEPVPILQQVLEGVAPANTDAVVVDIQPGTQMRYSGGGTTLAQLTLQDVANEPLPTMAQRLLFTPLGMMRSGFEQPISSNLSNNMATPYDGDGAPIKGGAHTYATLAAAGMWSTPSDILKMASGVRSAYLGQKTDWLSQASAQEMLTNNTPTNEAPNVGIGFFINMDDNGKILGFGHGGADAGFMSQLYIELDTGNGYAIMTNGNNGMQLIRELEIRLKEALDVGYSEPEIKTLVPITQKELNKYIGTYVVTNPVNVDVVLEESPDGFVLNALPYVENERYFHEGEGRFFAKNGSSIRFESDTESEGGFAKMLVMDNNIRGVRKE
ncbi:serine hydrolase [Alteromonas sp. D210916BOD_24]|uniref:serine hydrolase n=1 Tax=Alteromonas sp. D210916BOD_24 TaxID=3157618 RepID=UPI00399C51F9